MLLNQEQFELAVKRGMNLLSALKADYPVLRLYPVFCRFGSRSGQCPLTTDPLEILQEFPEMMEIPPDLVRLGETVRAVSRLKKEGIKVPAGLDQELTTLKSRLPDPLPVNYWGDVHVEFRLGAVKYSVLHQLQRDPRLPAELNEVGTARVVAGTLEQLCLE